MRLAALGLLALTLAACPKKPPPPPDEPPEPLEELPALVLDRAGLTTSLVPALTAAPPEGLAVGELARRHDADRYTATLQTWGPPDVRVLQLEDTDSPTRTQGAIAAWKLAANPERTDVVPVAPGDLRDGAVAAELVTSVLVRDWVGDPTAADPFALLLDVAAELPAPWSVCRPRTALDVDAEEAEDADPSAMASVLDPTRLFAVDAARGVRIGLYAEDEEARPGQGPFTWRIDHLEFAPAARPVERLWTGLGYADCPEIGRVIDAEKVKRPKRPLGPPDA